MTADNPYTQRAILRRLKAVKAAGLRIQEIRADGTIVVAEVLDNTSGEERIALTGEPRLRDARQKLG